MISRLCTLASLFLALLPATATCQQPLSLIDATKSRGGWTFDNGSEFPGAKGKLDLAADSFRDQPVLSLYGDFTAGGNYVQAQTTLPEVPVDTLSFWVNVPPGCKSLPIRLIDGSDQCHQLKVKLNDKGGWQQVVVPVEEFFQKMGTAAALDITSQYEKWDGAKDGKWHQPGKSMVVLCTRIMGTECTVLISDVRLLPGKPKTAVKKTIALDEMLELGEIDWGFNLGQEFPGAKGGLDVVKDQPAAGQNAMRLRADFTAGGAYVGMRKSFAHLEVEAMSVIRLKMRSTTTKQYGMRLVDGSGQCHQQKAIPFTADGQWHDVEIVPAKFAGGEHWGGANDGKWHDSVKLVELMLNDRSDEGKRPDLFIAEIRAEVVVAGRAAVATFNEGFESGSDRFRRDWRISGDVRLDGPGHNGTQGALVLARTLETIQTETAATSRTFDVSAGAWQVQYAWKADLHSPDNSYHGSVAMDVLDRSGAVLETVPIDIGYGKKDWQASSNVVTLPPGAAQARFRVQLNKTYGVFCLDDLSASRLSVQPVERRVERILLATDAVGNLFMPGDEVVFRATVEAVKPLPAAEQRLRFSLRDYWGAEQMLPGEVSLGAQPRKSGRFVYAAEVALPGKDLEVGKYYELHVGVPQDSGEPVAEYSGLAVLPPASTKRHAPEEVPFTIRNWDSRVPAYFHLADRLGLRMLGVWGGWSSKPPYRPHCPGIDLCEQLGAKWITGTPASQIERQGFATYSEDALRQGMRNFLETYAKRGMAMIAMGNEPHGKGEKVLENVRAYRAVYETVKAFDPTIHVIGTSVEPNEEYFKAGYYKYLDSYDFHIYEHYTNVRRTMREYRELMKKYDAFKPIHSTELGLNSQGQTRLAVSREMIKKCVVFFAEGGQTVSWFTIQYPDPKGTARGQFGDSHCMFDCKYNLYNPRLDAVTHYHVVNGIGAKKFVEEKQYPGGAQAFLFRDAAGRCLQVLWLDDKRADVSVSLPADKPIELVRIDGSRQTLQSRSGEVTLTLSEDPILLLYDDKGARLAASLGKPAASLVGPPAAGQDGAVSFSVAGDNLTPELIQVVCPPLWKASLDQSGEGRVTVTATPRPSTPGREARFRVQLVSGVHVTGELAVSHCR